MKNLIKVVKGRKENYYIYEIGAGFFAEVRSNSKLKHSIEILKDYIGESSKHPVFLNTFCLQSIISVENRINIIEKLKYEKN